MKIDVLPDLPLHVLLPDGTEIVISCNGTQVEVDHCSSDKQLNSFTSVLNND